MATCKLGTILDGDITLEEQNALLQAIHNDDLWSAKALSNAINKTRFSVGATTIKEHRRKVCVCFNE